MAQNTLRQDGLGVPPSSRPVRSLDPRLLEALAQAFADHAGADQLIDARDLQRVLRLRSEFLAQRMLSILDRDGDGQISREEFMAVVRRLVFGSARDKLRLAFQIHDLDDNGRIEREEIRRMIAMNLDEEAGSDASGVHSTRRRESRVEELTHLLLSTADEDANQSLCFEELERVTASDPELLELIAKNEAYWLLPEVGLTGARKPASLRARLSRLADNRRSLTISFVLLGALGVALFTSNALRYRTQGPWLMLAHGAGGCLNVVGALVLLPVMRRSLNWLRLTAIGRFLPIDDALLVHRVLGVSAFVLGVIHSLAHFANYSRHGGVWASITGTSAGTTGCLLLLVSLVMWGFSLRRIRKSGHFELFYYTHFAYIAWFGLALLHGPRFYKFALLPVMAFACDWLLRRRRRVHVSRMLSLSGLSSGVTRLELELPPGFAARPGDYAYLRIPSLARFEWHPFTISNAPGSDRLCFHIRSEGDWTKSLRQMADGRAALLEVVVNIDGPFGTPSRRVLAARHAVMIGAGIGVTPFASVLESMIVRAHAGESQLEKLYFFWLNRDSRSFEWFAELLLKAEQMDHRGLVDIHICMTGGRGNVAALALNLARNLAHEIGKPDWVTGLRTQTRIGAPDFDAELAAIAARHAPDPVEVFFCGPPGLGRKLSASCQRLGMRFHEEVF